MSTKIYNGYKLHKMNNTELMLFLRTVREQFKIRSVYNIREYFSDIINTKTLSVFRKHDLISERLLSASNSLRKSSECFDAEVVVLFGKKRVYILTYFNQHWATSLWESFSEVIEFQYWDNTDKPEHISEKQWKSIGKEWDELLGNKPPSEVGLVYNLFSVDDFSVYDVDSV